MRWQTTNESTPAVTIDQGVGGSGVRPPTQSAEIERTRGSIHLDTLIALAGILAVPIALAVCVVWRSVRQKQEGEREAARPQGDVPIPAWQGLPERRDLSQREP